MRATLHLTTDTRSNDANDVTEHEPNDVTECDKNDVTKCGLVETPTVLATNRRAGR
jgi:hypothetical protein